MSTYDPDKYIPMHHESASGPGYSSPAPLTPEVEQIIRDHAVPLPRDVTRTFPEIDPGHPYRNLVPFTLRLVKDEAHRAFAKHGPDNVPMNPAMDDGTKLAILMEEVGEVAKTMTHDGEGIAARQKELAQVAYVALAWLQSMCMIDNIIPNDQTDSETEVSPENG